VDLLNTTLIKNLKILFVLFTILFFILTNSKLIIAQVFEGDVTLSSQAEVDAFTRTEVTGCLIIPSVDMANLIKQLIIQYTP
jgi:hypothetical protein